RARPRVARAPHAVAEPVPELVAVAGLGDELAGDRVDGLALGPGPHRVQGGALRAQDQVVDGARLVLDRAGGHRARAIRAVALVTRAPVDHDERTRGDLDVARLGVRERAVRAGGDDGGERRFGV